MTLPCEDAVILIGGKGNRLGAVTEKTHKSLIRIQGVPILVYTLIALRKSGVKNLYLTSSSRSAEIKAFMTAYDDFGFHTYYSNGRDCCVFHALLDLKEPLGGRSFALSHTDIIVPCDVFINLILIFEKKRPLGVAGLSPHHRISTHPYSTVDAEGIIDGLKLMEDSEAVTAKWFCWNGTYVFDSKWFELLATYKGTCAPGRPLIPEVALQDVVKERVLLGLVLPENWFHLAFPSDLEEGERGLNLDIMRCYKEWLDGFRIRFPS